MKDITGYFGVGSIAQANPKHLGGVQMVQLVLCIPVASFYPGKGILC